jgi:hypothetical protein
MFGSTRLRPLALVVALAACGDGGPSVPDESRAPRHPLSGTYDVTTTLTAFTFETAAPSPPDCPDYTLYCTHRRGAGDGRLTGVLVIGDSAVPLSANVTELRGVRGTFTGRFCDVVDRAGLTGCARTGESAMLDYPVGVLVVAAPFDGGQPFTISLRGPESLGPNIHLVDVRLRGDSLVGDVRWAMTQNRSPPTYWGTFVARRRR